VDANGFHRSSEDQATTGLRASPARSIMKTVLAGRVLVTAGQAPADPEG